MPHTKKTSDDDENKKDHHHSKNKEEAESSSKKKHSKKEDAKSSSKKKHSKKDSDSEETTTTDDSSEESDDSSKKHNKKESRKNNSKSEKEGDYEYDLIVVGGGSSGTTIAEEAKHLKKKVLLVNHSEPSPQGTTWSHMGGTCLNVGCIPKILMHHASLVGDAIATSYKYGWRVHKPNEPLVIDWTVLKREVLNFQQKLQSELRKSLIRQDETCLDDYINGSATLVDEHTISIAVCDNEKSTKKATGKYIVVATGLRPNLPDDICGAREHCITSDDIWTLDHPPGNTLIIGMGYVATEIAGLLINLGYKVTMVNHNNVFLAKKMDNDMVERIKRAMIVKGIRLHFNVTVSKVCKNKNKGFDVTWKKKDEEEVTRTYDTVICCVGHFKTMNKILKPENVGLELAKSGQIKVDKNDRTNIPSIYAIGDIAADRPQFVPTGVMTAKLLARRLFNNSSTRPDFSILGNAVFTPIESATIGMTEEAAIKEHGEDGIEVYHREFMPYEFAIPAEEDELTWCYMKVICTRDKKERVLGLHYFGPHAGEMVMGFGVAMKMGMTMRDMHSIPEIHPTSAGHMVLLNVTKRSGDDYRVVD